MPALPDTDDYRALFLRPTPMMDMRAPAEFTQGSFPSALSLPLMSDEERARVGICYKKKGQAAAIELGHQIVCGETKQQRLQQWQAFTQQHPSGYLYCFRGGLRSQTVQAWLRDAGIDYPLVKGGYKAMRRFLLEELESSIESANIVLISGKTGTGKTQVISWLARSVDLEGMANHRGSSFGQLITPQPSQIDFENALSIALMRLLAAGQKLVYLEDEGRLIGRRHLPNSLIEKMKIAPMLVVEQTLEQRIDVVLEDYVLDLGRRYLTAFGEDGHVMHRDKMLADLDRISKRLGGERHRQVSKIMAAAFDLPYVDGDLSLHRQWIGFLLEKYYDPMYEYQLKKRAGAQLFQGDRDAVVARAMQDATDA